MFDIYIILNYDEYINDVLDNRINEFSSEITYYDKDGNPILIIIWKFLILV